MKIDFLLKFIDRYIRICLTMFAYIETLATPYCYDDFCVTSCNNYREEIIIMVNYRNGICVNRYWVIGCLTGFNFTTLNVFKLFI
jgi:hypothetical protein